MKRYFHTSLFEKENFTIKKYFAPGSRHTFKLKEHFAPIQVRCLVANKTTAVLEVVINTRTQEPGVILMSIVDGETRISTVGKNGNTVHEDFTGIYNEGEGFFTTENEERKVYKEVKAGDVLNNSGKSGRVLHITAIGPDGALFGYEESIHVVHGPQKHSRIVQIDSQQAVNLGIEARKVEGLLQ